MANARQIAELKGQIEELRAALAEVSAALEGPCPLCHNHCDPGGPMCHRGREYFTGSMERRQGVDRMPPGRPF